MKAWHPNLSAPNCGRLMFALLVTPTLLCCQPYVCCSCTVQHRGAFQVQPSDQCTPFSLIMLLTSEEFLRSVPVPTGSLETSSETWNTTDLQPAHCSICISCNGVQGINITAYSPLGSNDSEQMFGREGIPKVLDDETVCSIARELGWSPAQVRPLPFTIDCGLKAVAVISFLEL